MLCIFKINYNSNYRQQIIVSRENYFKMEFITKILKKCHFFIWNNFSDNNNLQMKACTKNIRTNKCYLY